MRTTVLFLSIAACGSPEHAAAPDAPGDAAPEAPPAGVYASCTAAAFAGVFAGEPQVQAQAAVIQTYHSTSALGVMRTGPDLAAIFARGKVAHLNVEPAPGELTGPMAAAIADAIAAAPGARLFVTFGAEMNGNWVTWGCLPAADYVARYRAFHGEVASALDARGLDRRRVRWAYGPNSTSSASCGSAAGYYPGHAYVDVLGMSAYRAGTQTVAQAVTQPMAQLFAALGYPAAWQRGRFVVLQTGSRAAADRQAWITELFTTSATDARIAGTIYFDAADWAAPPAMLGSAMPVVDARLDATFLPYFWDVGCADPGFGEIQALRDHGITAGCATAPTRFCPDEPLTADATAALLARAFPGAAIPTLPSPLTERALADALRSLGGDPPEVTEAVVTRARAAVLIARGARIDGRGL